MKCRNIVFLLFAVNSIWGQNQFFIGSNLGTSRLKSSISTLEAFLGDTRLGRINIYSDPGVFYDIKFGDILSVNDKSSIVLAVGLKNAGFHYDDITKETNLVTYSRTEMDLEATMRYSIYKLKRKRAIQLALGLEFSFIINEELDSYSMLMNSEFSKKNLRIVGSLIYKLNKIDLVYKYRHSVLDEYYKINTQNVGNYYLVFQSFGFIYRI